MISKNLPQKLVERIWRKEYIDFDLLRPAKLGSPEPTLGDLITCTRRKDKSTAMSIQEWVIYFNSYLAIIAERDTNRVKDPLFDSQGQH